MQNLEQKLQNIVSRIENISFFNLMSIDEANSLLPQVKDLIDKYSCFLYYNPKFENYDMNHIETQLLKRKAFKQGTYNIIKKHYVGINKKIENNSCKTLSKVRNDIHDKVGSCWVWNPIIRNLIKETKNFVYYFIWNEVMKDENEINPFEPFIQLYELGLKPARTSLVLINKEGKEINLKNELLIEFPLQKYQAHSNIAKCSIYDKEVVMRRLNHLNVKDFRRHYAILETPEIMERFTLATLIKDSKKLEYVRYWTEKHIDYNHNTLTELRPLISVLQ